MHIQSTEVLQYDDIFIMLQGLFEMEFFKAIGNLITALGGPDMLTEINVLAPASLNGFLSGKNFNRCKCLHPILTVAFEILLFNALNFLKTYEKREQQ